jgi:hypothetical protein
VSAQDLFDELAAEQLSGGITLGQMMNSHGAAGR